MKIGIIGTRGIPNHYGGFEQFAEYLSKYLVLHGHDVTVYNSHDHPYKLEMWEGVKLVHKYDPENRFGTVGQFFYDLNCILDARKMNFDIILQLGYTSSSIWSRLLPRKPQIVTNMDGLEWKRSKYSPKVQRFLRYAEKLAIKHSDFLISDSVGIEEYLYTKYGKKSLYIPYGALPFTSPDAEVIREYGVSPGGYSLLIARLEPENSIEIILDGVSQSPNQQKFLVIGKHSTKFGEYLKNKYRTQKHIFFLGAIYNLNALNNLRYYSDNYFHGHTVGGTNPSLLEAMASQALITAHNNVFNKSILGNDAYYFTTAKDVVEILTSKSKNSEERQDLIAHNLVKIETVYPWDKINEQYESFFRSIAKN